MRIRWGRQQLFVITITAIVAMLPGAAAQDGANVKAPLAVAGMLIDEKALAGVHDVQLQGNFAYVAGKRGSVAVVDVAEPTKPRIVWSRNDPQAFEDAETVLPAGDYLFLGSRDFHALDIRDPRRPALLQTITDRARIDRINGMVRLKNLILAANKEGWIDAFDVSSPTKPKFFGSLDVKTRDAMSNPHDVALLGDLLVLSDAAGMGRARKPGQLAVYRFLDEATHAAMPADQWILVGRVTSLQLAGANRVRVAGSIAYAACSVSPEATDRTGLRANVSIVDLAQPKHPALLAAVPFPDQRGPNGLTVAGRMVFAAGGQTILAIDVSDPRRPEVLATFRPLELFRGDAGRDDAHDLVYRDGYLYVTGQSTHSFGVIRIDDARIRRLANGR